MRMLCPRPLYLHMFVARSMCLRHITLNDCRFWDESQIIITVFTCNMNFTGAYYLIKLQIRIQNNNWE